MAAGAQVVPKCFENLTAVKSVLLQLPSRVNRTFTKPADRNKFELVITRVNDRGQESARARRPRMRPVRAVPFNPHTRQETNDVEISRGNCYLLTGPRGPLGRHPERLVP